jgi:hypothetical protein
VEFAGGPQHTGLSSVASQAFDAIHWQTPVDLKPAFSGNDLLIHYGTPLVTPNNTVIVPVKTGQTDGFEVQGIDGATGRLKWTVATDYILPVHGWTPSFGMTLTPSGQLVFPGAGGTVYFMNTPDADGATISGHLAFYGIQNYSHAAFDSTVFINTPLTSDNSGTLFFGFFVTGTAPLGLSSGIARITSDGFGAWVSAADAAGDPGITKVVHNCAPALSNDGTLLYVAVSDAAGTGSGHGYLVALSTITLQNVARVALVDPVSGLQSNLPEDGSATPMVGPDGDVYFGVLENPFATSKGWLLHFSASLAITKTPSAFGWDNTASIVPVSMVPFYQGPSSYLLVTKYNNYADTGGDGINRVAVVDPNVTQVDPRTGAVVMAVVESVVGPTPDPKFRPTDPNAVREWCINDAAVDPATDSVLVNSEDGKLYRWYLPTNQLIQAVTLTPGIGEAYTPTVVGTDGTVFAINDATLFAVGATVQGTLNRRYVTHLYEDILGREPEYSGMIGWGQVLNQGASRFQVAAAIMNSFEYRTNQVRALYRYFLHRAGDGPGIRSFANMLANGTTIEQVAEIMIGSDEYYANRAGNDFNTFLNVMYQDSVHRNIDPGAMSFFIANRNRFTRAQMAAFVVPSHERHQQLVSYPNESTSGEFASGLLHGYFQRFLHRDAKASGLNTFTGLLDNGATDEFVIASIVSSQEYYNRT